MSFGEKVGVVSAVLTYCGVIAAIAIAIFSQRLDQKYAVRQFIKSSSVVTGVAIVLSVLIIAIFGDGKPSQDPIEGNGVTPIHPVVKPVNPLPTNTDHKSELEQAAAKWRNHTWPIGQSFGDLIKRLDNGPPDLDDPNAQADMDLIRKAELVIDARKKSAIDRSIVICVEPDVGGEGEANNAIAGRLVDIINQRGRAESVCSGTDIVLRVKARSTPDGDNVAVSAEASAYWYYDNAPISGFPVYKDGHGSEVLLNGQGKHVNGNEAYNEASAKLAAAVFKSLYGD